MDNAMSNSPSPEAEASISATTAVPHHLRLKLGDYEFECAGKQELVQEHYEEFKELFSELLQAKAESPTVKDGDESDNAWASQWEQVYAVDDDGGTSLLVLPSTKHQTSDALLLILYGHQCVTGNEYMKTTDLMSAAKQSGLRIDRVERNLKREHAVLVNKGGSGKGARYQLNNRGKAYCQELLEDMLEG